MLLPALGELGTLVKFTGLSGMTWGWDAPAPLVVKLQEGANTWANVGDGNGLHVQVLRGVLGNEKGERLKCSTVGSSYGATRDCGPRRFARVGDAAVGVHVPKLGEGAVVVGLIDGDGKVLQVHLGLEPAQKHVEVTITIS